MFTAKPIFLLAAMTALTATTAVAQTSPAQTDAAQPAQQPQAAASGEAAATQPATPPATVGGAVMDPAATIIQNISKSADHSELVKVLTASGVDLSAVGPFTLFAADNGAFGRLAPGTVDTLLKPENKATLVKVINYQIVPGALRIEDIKKQAEANGGTATLTTLTGQTIAMTFEGGVVKITDANNNPAYVAQGDIKSANGLIHITNGVLLPKL